LGDRKSREWIILPALTYNFPLSDYLIPAIFAIIERTR